MRKLGMLFGMGAVLAASASAQEAGAATGATGLQELSEAELLERATANWFRDRDTVCDVQSPAAAELVRRDPDNEVSNRLSLTIRSICADMEGRYDDALAHVEEGMAKWGLAQDMIPYGMVLAGRAEDGEAALHYLQLAIDAGIITGADVELVFWLLRTIRQADLDDRLEALALNFAQAPGFARVDDEIQTAFAYPALDAALEAENFELAGSLLQHMRQPTAYAALLANRKYEPIWPAVEAQAGENFNALTERYLDWARARYEADPADRELFSVLAHALMFDGRFEDAIALVDEWRSQPDAIENIEEGDAWALNVSAYSHDALGQFDRADAIFDELATLSEDQPWAVNFVINRASRLVSHGRWEEGLAANTIAKEAADATGTTYAKMLVALNRACALAHLGRAAEAEEDVGFLREHVDEATQVAAGGLICMGNEDEAVDLVISQLENEDTRAGMIGELQPREFEFFYTPSVLPDARDLVAKHPRLAETLARYARRIPERFYPAAALKRAALPQAER